MEIRDPKFAMGQRVLHTVRELAGEPMFKGTVVAMQWCSDHLKDPIQGGNWYYTIEVVGVSTSRNANEANLQAYKEPSDGEVPTICPIV